MWTLTEMGTRLGGRLAMSGDEDEAVALLDALLDAAEADTLPGQASRPREEARPLRDGPLVLLRRRNHGMQAIQSNGELVIPIPVQRSAKAMNAEFHWFPDASGGTK
jgi:hypothetical protein